jgi:type I restriction enzyme M protein
MPKLKSPTTATTAQSLGSLLKSARDIMRKDKGLNGDLDRLPMLTWIMFLKFLDDLEIQREEEAKLAGKKFKPAIEVPYRWRDWAANPEGLTGDALLAFINQEEATLPNGRKGTGLFHYLRQLTSSNGDNRRDVIATVFRGVQNRMINGYLLRDLVNKIGAIHFTSSGELHTLGSLYESMLREMRDAAGDSGEFYTPRAVVRFMVEVTNPRLGETILDPACGTGGFLVESYNYLSKQVKTVADRKILQEKSIFGCEAKSLPYLLAQMNLLLHGLDAPQIDPGNALRFKLTEIGERDRVDVILTNPPFGGEEEKGIQNNFPSDKQTSETALLFLQLIMRKLRKVGRASPSAPPARAAVVVPNGTLFGDGVCARIKEELLKEFNLHTILKLPAGVFSPYTDIETNILFFDRSGPTQEIWYYEHPLPAGRPKYTKTKQIRFEEFEPCMHWLRKRQENEQAWLVSLQQIAEGGYNLDIKNPRTPTDECSLSTESVLESLVSRESQMVASVRKLQGTVLDDLNLVQVWPLKPIHSFAKRIDRSIVPIPGREYRILGVRLWGEGVYEREPLDGGNTRYSRFTQVKTGDIVVNKIWARNGSVGVVSKSQNDCFVTSEFPVFGPDFEQIDPDWFRWVTRMRYFWKECEEKSRGTTGKNRIRPEKFLEINVPLPQRDEQTRLVQYLDALQSEVGALKHLQSEAIAELDALLPSILDKAFKGEL